MNSRQDKFDDPAMAAPHQHARDCAMHVMNIGEEEREHLALIIHDEIGVLLTAMKMDLSWLAQRLPQADRDLQERTLAMSKLLDMAFASSIDLVHSLRPGYVDCFGIVAAIEIEAEKFTRRTGIPCRITKPDACIELAGERSITLFRVFQETLNLIMGNSAATNVHVEIIKTESCIGLAISDGRNATGKLQTRPYNLRNVRRHIKHIGGDVNITSQSGYRTLITVRVPLDDSFHALNSMQTQQRLF